MRQEATRARLNVGGPDDPRNANDVLQAPLRPGLAVSGIMEHPEQGWAARSGKVVNPGQVALDPDLAFSPAEMARLNEGFTTTSRGVLADVVRGGLKKDLSLAFEMEDSVFNLEQWEGMATPFRGGVAGGEVPIFPPVNSAEPVNIHVSFGAASYTHRFETGGVATFDNLRSHYRSYRHLYEANGGATAFLRPQESRWWNTGSNAPQSAGQIAPMLRAGVERAKPVNFPHIREAVDFVAPRGGGPVGGAAWGGVAAQRVAMVRSAGSGFMLVLLGMAYRNLGILGKFCVFL